MTGPFIYQDKDVQDLAYMAYGGSVSLILIVGAPSSGKTTFLDAIAGQLGIVTENLDSSDGVVRYRAAEFWELVSESDTRNEFRNARYVFVDDLDHLYESSTIREACEKFLTRWINDDEKPKRFLCGFGDFVENLAKRTGTDSPALKNAFEWLLFPTLKGTDKADALTARTKVFLKESATRAAPDLNENENLALDTAISEGADHAVTASGGHPLLLAMACNRILSSVILPFVGEMMMKHHENAPAGAIRAESARVWTPPPASLNGGDLREMLFLDSGRVFSNIIQWVRRLLSEQCWNQVLQGGEQWEDNHYSRQENLALAISGLFAVRRVTGQYVVPSKILCPLVQDHLKLYWRNHEHANTNLGPLALSNPAQMQAPETNKVFLEPQAGGRIGLLRCGDTQVHLSSVEWRIIEVMRVHARTVLPVVEIANALASTDSTESAEQNQGAVRAAISRLQEKLQAEGLGHLLVNVPRKGYVFDVVVA